MRFAGKSALTDDQREVASVYAVVSRMWGSNRVEHCGAGELFCF